LFGFRKFNKNCIAYGLNKQINQNLGEGDMSTQTEAKTVK